MKKILSAITAFLPVIYAAAVFVLFLIDSTDGLLAAVMIGYIAIALLILGLYLYYAVKETPRILSLNNLFFYSINLLFMAAEVIYWLVYYHQTQIEAENGALGGGLGLVLLILLYLPHWASYLLTHIVGATCCGMSLKGKCRTEVQVFHIILQLLPVTDLISAVWVLQRVQKQEKML